MTILGLNKTTLLDYPEHLAATIFTGNCNLRCPFCHNRDLVFSQEGITSGRVIPYTEEEILSFLEKRKSILQAVCITGGEPTLQPDLEVFIRKIKKMGYLVKLDTNGFCPDVLQRLVKQHLLDYVAVDIKNSPQKYAQTTGLSTCQLSQLQETVAFLLSSDNPVSYEFRTTIVKEFHTKQDMIAICHWIQGAPLYFLQSFVSSDHMISEGYTAHDSDTMHDFLKICQTYLPSTKLRGVE